MLEHGERHSDEGDRDHQGQEGHDETVCAVDLDLFGPPDRGEPGQPPESVARVPDGADQIGDPEHPDRESHATAGCFGELRRDLTIVIVTHSMQQAARVSQRTAFFHLGEMVEYGRTKDIFTNPRESRTQDYITGRYG